MPNFNLVKIVSIALAPVLLITGLSLVPLNSNEHTKAEVVTQLDGPEAVELATPEPVTSVSISAVNTSGTLYDVSLNSNLAVANQGYRFAIRDAQTRVYLSTCTEISLCTVSVDRSLHQRVYGEVENVKSQTLKLSDGTYESMSDAWELTLSVANPEFKLGVESSHINVSGVVPSGLTGTYYIVVTRLTATNSYSTNANNVTYNYTPDMSSKSVIKSQYITATGAGGTSFSYNFDHAFAREGAVSYSARVMVGSTSALDYGASSPIEIHRADYNLSVEVVSSNISGFTVRVVSNQKIIYLDGFHYSVVLHELVTNKWLQYSCGDGGPYGMSGCTLLQTPYENTQIVMPYDSQYDPAKAALAAASGWAVEAYVARYDCVNGESQYNPCTGSQYSTISRVKEVQAKSAIVIVPKNFIPVEEIKGGYNPSQSCNQSCGGDPINVSTGEYWENISDIRPMSADNLPLEFVRTYGSNSNTENVGMGLGWNSGYQMAIRPGATTLSSTLLTERPVLSVRQENGSLVTFVKTPNGYLATGDRVKAELSVANGMFTFDRFNGQKFQFDSVNGKLLRQIDASQNSSIEIVYDALERISRAESTNGQWIKFHWSSSNQLESLESSTGLEIKYFYTGSLLTKVVDSAGRTYLYSYNSLNRIITKTDPMGGVTTNTYTGARVTSQTDPSGGVTTFSASGADSVVNGTGQITLPSGASTIYTYTSGRVTKVTQGNRVWQYVYDGAGNLSKIVNPDNSFVTYLYDDKGNQISATDEIGRIQLASFNDKNLPTHQDRLKGASVDFTYNPVTGEVTGSTDANGNLTQYTHNGGRLDTTYLPNGSNESYEYDSLGYVSKFTDALGGETTYVRDTQGRVLSKTDPNYGQTIFEYDLAGNVTKITDAEGHITEFSYDLLDRVKTIKNPDSKIAYFSYDPIGRITQEKDFSGAISNTVYSYSAANTIVTTTDSVGVVTTKYIDQYDSSPSLYKGGKVISAPVFNNRGWLSSVSGYGREAERYTYDAAGQIIKSSPYDTTATTTYTYDNVGNLKTKTDPKGRVTTYSYDANGNVLSVVRNDGATESYLYDESDSVTNYIDGANQNALYEYDLAGNLTRYTDSSVDWSFEYDAVGNMTKKTDINSGLFVNFEYDATNNLIAQRFSDSTPNVEYIRDSLGRVIETQDGTGNTYRTYDDMNRVLSVTNGTDITSYTYDTAGRRTSVTSPSGAKTNYTYNAAGQILTIQNNAMGTVTNEYNASSGLLTKVIYPNGINTVMTYNTNSLLLTSVTKRSNVNVLSLAYTYGIDSTIATVSTTLGTSVAQTKSYNYDPISRLDSVTTGGITNQFDYSSNHQVTELPNGSSILYNSQGRAESISLGGVSIGIDYDYSGNRSEEEKVDSSGASPVTTEEREYSFNADGRLTTAEISKLTGEKEVSYTYDGQGLLASRSVDDGITANNENMYWDSARTIPVLLEDGGYSYIYDARNTPIAQVSKSGSVVSFLHTDNIGTVRTVTGSTGLTITTRSYSEYGSANSGDVNFSSTRFGFAGEYTDSVTGLVYIRSRWLDTLTGQFISIDPRLNETHTTYGYTTGNPLIYVDPLGMTFLGAPFLTGLVAGFAGDLWNMPFELLVFEQNRHNEYLKNAGVDDDSILYKSAEKILGVCTEAFKNGKMVGDYLRSISGTGKIPSKLLDSGSALNVAKVLGKSVGNFALDKVVDKTREYLVNEIFDEDPAGKKNLEALRKITAWGVKNLTKF